MAAEALKWPDLGWWQHLYVDPSGCWVWAGKRNRDGYGYSYSFSIMLVHRATYTLLVGPIPAGLEADHLCHNRACANPAHLALVTRAENMRRRWERERSARLLPN